MIWTPRALIGRRLGERYDKVRAKGGVVYRGITVQRQGVYGFGDNYDGGVGLGGENEFAPNSDLHIERNTDTHSNPTLKAKKRQNPTPDGVSREKGKVEEHGCRRPLDALGALQVGDVAPAQAGPLGKLRLRPAALLPELLDPVPQSHVKILAVLPRLSSYYVLDHSSSPPVRNFLPRLRPPRLSALLTRHPIGVKIAA